MMKKCLVALFILIIVGISPARADRQAVDYVNPLIGTPYAGFEDGLGGGGTMPCVGPPFAMTNFVAQTCENRISRIKIFIILTPGLWHRVSLMVAGIPGPIGGLPKGTPGRIVLAHCTMSKA